MAEEQCDTVLSVRTCLTRLQSVGLAIVAESGMISFVALMLLFGLIIRNIIRYYRYPPDVKWRLINSPADAYVLSLFVADLLQSIGAAMDIKWVREGVVQVGHYCTAQGTIQQIGETSVAFATGVIAIHTCIVVWTRKGAHNLKVACGVIALTWLFVILYVAIAASTKHDYYNPDPLWCWIGDQYLKDKIAGEYVWLWATLIISFVVYFPLFLWSIGHITVDAKVWWKVQWHWRAHPASYSDTSIRARPDAPSLALLAYPVAYTIVVLPVSIARWVSFTGHDTPNAATFFTVFLHNSFGAVNVLLLLTTRPTLLLFVDPRTLRRDSDAGSDIAPVHHIKGHLEPNGRAPSPSETRSVTSIRTAEEMRENAGYEGAAWTAGTDGVYFDETGDAHWRQPGHQGGWAAAHANRGEPTL